MSTSDMVERATRLDRLAGKAMDKGLSEAVVNGIFDKADKAWDAVERAAAAEKLCPTTTPEIHLAGEFPMTCYQCHMEADS